MPKFLPREEQETVLIYTRCDNSWLIYTDMVGSQRSQLLRLAKAVGSELKTVGEHGVEFSLPGNALHLKVTRPFRKRGTRQTPAPKHWGKQDGSLEAR